MSGSFKDISVTLFELISYVFPGLVLIFGISVLFHDSFNFLASNIFFALFISYILGGILHELNNSTISFENLLWKVYHFFKEKDERGKGIKKPITTPGKFAKLLRYSLLENENKNDLKSENVIKDIFGLSGLDPINLHILKESILANNLSLNSNYQHLHYQYIFNRSLSLVLRLLALIYFLFDYLYVLEITLSENLTWNIDGKGLIVAITLIPLSYLHYKRSKFFHRYRKIAINAAVLLYDRKDQK